MAWILTSAGPLPDYNKPCMIVVDNVEKPGCRVSTDHNGEHWIEFTDTGKKPINNVTRWYEVEAL